MALSIRLALLPLLMTAACRSPVPVAATTSPTPAPTVTPMPATSPNTKPKPVTLPAVSPTSPPAVWFYGGGGGGGGSAPTAAPLDVSAVSISYPDAPGLQDHSTLWVRHGSPVAVAISLVGTGEASGVDLFLDGTAAAGYTDGFTVGHWDSRYGDPLAWQVPQDLTLGSHRWHVVATEPGGSKRHWAFAVTVGEAVPVDAVIH